MIEKKVSHLYEKEIFFLKISCKTKFTLTYDKRILKKWKFIYPESNKYIMKFKALPFHLRIIGWAVAHGIWPWLIYGYT